MNALRLAKGGTLMDMRSAAALLLLIQIVPAITSVVCELTCVQHEHHSAEAAPEQNCHEQRSSDGPAVTSGTAVCCHDRAEASTTTAADSRVLKGVPVVIQPLLALAAHHPQIPVMDRSASFGPPGMALQTTQLRI